MDIWSWYFQAVEALEETQPALASRLEKLPSYAVDQQGHLVDALAPELIAALRAIEHGWLEVFVRHWWLQSRVIRRADVSNSALTEAVDLIERAHRPDTEGCPQAVCAAQDLCRAYALVDGPGYAEQRLAAAGETLARIDPAWPCWKCLSEEYGNALVDSGRPDEAVAFMEEQTSRMDLADGEHSVFESIEPLLSAGKFEAALEAATAYDASDGGSFGECTKALNITRSLIHLERLEEALEALPDWRLVSVSAGHFRPYTDALSRLIVAGRLVWEEQVTQRIVEMLDGLERHEAWGVLFDVSRMWAAAAANERTADWALGRLLLDRARQAQTRLVDPHRGDALLEPIERQIEAQKPAPWEGPLEILAEKTEGRELSLAMAQLAVSVASASADPIEKTQQVLVLTHYWRSLGFVREAVDLLVKARSSERDHLELWEELAEALSEAGSWKELELLLDESPEGRKPAQEALALQFRSLMLERRDGDLPGAVRCLEGLRSDFSEFSTPSVLERLAKLYEKAGDFEAALPIWNSIIEIQEEGCHWDWDRIVCATRLGRWEIVRDSAARLGFSFDSESGPIDEAWGWIHLLDMHHETEPKSMGALRTGPVTARIQAITGPDLAERFGERVIFDPMPLMNETDSDGEEDDSSLTFAILETTQTSEFESFFWDGPHPEEQDLKAFFGALEDLGCSAYVASGDGYMQINPANDESQRAVYIKVAAPTTPSVREALLELFSALATKAGPDSAFWPELLESLGRTKEAETHRQKLVDWSMV